MSYGHIFDALRPTIIGLLINGKHTYTFFVVLVCISSVIFFIRKSNSNFYKITSLINYVSFLLILMPLFQIGQFLYSNGTTYFQKKAAAPIVRTTTRLKLESPPDIYYLIFDRYARADTLINEYGFDNSELIGYLQKKEFYVASLSRANYASTYTSLSSSLNMEYLDDVVKKMGENSSDVKPLQEMIENYEVWRYLKSRGYTVIHAGSWWTPTIKNRYADKNININFLSEFSETLYTNSIFYPMAIRFGVKFLDGRYIQWQREQYLFDEIAKVPEIKDPTFVFAHFLLPHNPYVYDANGNYVTKVEADKKDIKQKYIEQVKYANTKIMELVNTITTKSGNSQPIIIVQADEGPYPEVYQKDDQNFDWSKAKESEIKQKMGILNAYYLPNEGNKALYEHITPVNTFRLIFNQYFGESLEILPDVSYLSNKEKPYKLIKIDQEI